MSSTVTASGQHSEAAEESADTVCNMSTGHTESNHSLQRNTRKRTLHAQQSDYSSTSNTHGNAADDNYDPDSILECFYCKVCKQVLTSNHFYPSCLKRKVYYCKRCEQYKQVQRRQRRTGDAPQKLDKDEAMYMFERFRRRCAKQRTSQIEDDRATEAVAENGYEPEALLEELDLISNSSMTKLQLAFNVKTTRQLLKFWNRSSALGKRAHSTMPDQDAEPKLDAAESHHAKASKRRRMVNVATTQPPTSAATSAQLPESGQLLSQL